MKCNKKGNIYSYFIIPVYKKFRKSSNVKRIDERFSLLIRINCQVREKT